MDLNPEQFENLITQLGERTVLQKQSVFERHAQTALTGLIVILLAGVAGGLWAMHQSQNILVTGQAVQNVHIENLSKKIEEQTSNYVGQLEYAVFKSKMAGELSRLHEFVDSHDDIGGQ